MNDIEKALLTWYAKDHPLHNDPLHPAIKLAGEAGELLDLYGKHEYKPGFDWWRCKKCGLMGYSHFKDGSCDMDGTKFYTPLVLDEIGDIWYYIRILAYQAKLDLTGTVPDEDSLLKVLTYLNSAAANVLHGFVEEGKIFTGDFLYTYHNFLRLLQKLDVSLEQVTELNYRKLNSEPTANGWRKKS